MTPLLSVIIPTHRRPKQVSRAIASAIHAYTGFDIEILVVPNGRDDTWNSVAEQFRHDARIRWLYLPTGHASAARNHGLLNTHGKFVRFLDDDDYLLPAAVDQLKLIDEQNLDICSAPLESVSASGHTKGIIPLPATHDFVTAAIYSARLSLTQGSIFRRSLIKGILWREDVKLYDDYLWTLDLVTSREAIWAQTLLPVCAYVQHHGERLSRTKRSEQNSRTLTNALLQLHHHLQQQNRLTRERSRAVATALLTHAHSAFPASPFSLGSAIRQATAISPDAKPLQPFFETCPWLARHLLVVEWAILAPRYLTRSYRRAAWFTGKIFRGSSR